MRIYAPFPSVGCHGDCASAPPFTYQIQVDQKMLWQRGTYWFESCFVLEVSIIPFLEAPSSKGYHQDDLTCTRRGSCHFSPEHILSLTLIYRHAFRQIIGFRCHATGPTHDLNGARCESCDRYYVTLRRYNICRYQCYYCSTATQCPILYLTPAADRWLFLTLWLYLLQ
jgi:hypothetical protein